MSDPLIVEKSFRIAWEYLDRTGQITDRREASQFLVGVIETLIRKGERRMLMLSNRAIIAFGKRRQDIAA